ncbi:MAG: response regulator [Chloroflexota bacterium]
MPAQPHIVIFNHSPNLLKLFQAALSKKGYKISTHLQEMSHLDQIMQDPPDLIILGTLKGYLDSEVEIIQKIRQDSTAGTIPIIVCTTGDLFLAKNEQVSEVKYFSIVPKPFDIQDLLSAVEAALPGSNRIIDVKANEPNGSSDS